MDLALGGKVALVTGASTGIGRAVAECLAAEGAIVGLCSRRAEVLEQVAAAIRGAGGRAAVVAADLATVDGPRSAVERTVAALGGLDVLVNGGADHRLGTLDSYDDEEIERALQAKPIGYLRACRAAIPHLAVGRGVIINIAGSSAKSAPRDYTVNAVATGGLVAFTKALSDEVAPLGVRVVTVNPGPVQTPHFRDNLAYWAERRGITVSEAEAEVRAMIPEGRIPEPADIAGVVTFLASDRARFVNGSSVLVDGGRSRAVT
jgi:3-oxoacyl-[acyl-carrier protein] reductase